MSRGKMSAEEKKACSERAKKTWAEKKAKAAAARMLNQATADTVKPDMKTLDIQAKKISDPKVLEVSDGSFLQIEDAAIGVDGLEVHNLNPNYYPRWCREADVGSGRKGEWVVLNRNHPDFVGLRVNIDHSPDKSFIRFKDLILCVARRETRDKKRKALDEKAANKMKQFDAGVQRDSHIGRHISPLPK